MWFIELGYFIFFFFGGGPSSRLVCLCFRPALGRDTRYMLDCACVCACVFEREAELIYIPGVAYNDGSWECMCASVGDCSAVAPASNVLLSER